MAREAATRIGLVATDPMRVLGLSVVLCEEHGYTLVPLDEPRALDEYSPDLVLIDSSATLHLFELLAAFNRFRPQNRLIVFGASQEPDYVESVIGAGARGYLKHSASSKELVMAIEVVRDGSVWAPRKVLARLLDQSQKPPANDAPLKITPREQQVLALLVSGCPNRIIALSLGIDESTVKAHIGRLLRKARVHNRTALSVRAIENQWLPLLTK